MSRENLRIELTGPEEIVTGHDGSAPVEQLDIFNLDSEYLTYQDGLQRLQAGGLENMEQADRAALIPELTRVERNLEILHGLRRRLPRRAVIALLRSQVQY